jgi:hypothetical protein
MTRLERSYRRLMLAYPAAYRRRYASEIVTTLVDMSPPGRQRPPLTDAWHLLRSGVRQRLRLPIGRPAARAAAVLLTFVLGALGAAAGSWAAEQTRADLPSRDGFSAVSRQIGDGIDRWEQRDTTPHASASWWSDVDDPGWTPAAGRAALAATGWRVSGQRLLPAGQSYGPDGRLQPVTRTAFDATRDGLHLRVSGNTTAGHGLITVSMWPQSNGWRWPLTVAGAALGLLAGWPLAASLAYRVRRAPRGQARLAAALLTTGLAALLTPAAACYTNLGLMVRAAGDDNLPTTVHSAFTAGPFENWGWTWMILQLTVAGILVGLSGTAVALWDSGEALAADPALN